MQTFYRSNQWAKVEKDFGIKHCPNLRFASKAIEKEVRQRCEKALLIPSVKNQNDRILPLCSHELHNGAHIPYEIRKVNKKIGYGIFATAPILPLTFIGEYAGVITEECDDNGCYLFNYDIGNRSSRFVVDAHKEGGFTRFINHSTQSPPLSVVMVIADGISHIVFLANQAIEAGAELTYDYGDQYWTNSKVKPRP